MQGLQIALFVNPSDPGNAVIYDRSWLLAQLTDRGLCVVRAEPPTTRGFTCTSGLVEVEVASLCQLAGLRTGANLRPVTGP
jgi:hypothetical protein